ncbi:MAG: ImmA/IrrE family metallo-endopeptidase [Acidobacteriota bacterium]|nr:ImmA/IrrE family metallo-endopeptidase [Acidobacteriota bacterium]
MKLVPDSTRRFTSRPHYDPNELDVECEALVSDFLRAKHGEAAFPISTDDLTILLEQKIEDLDSMADLSDLGSDVEGVTYFFRRSKPRVRISKSLWDRDVKEHRLRTTLTHELGHVHFHGYLYQVDESMLSFLESRTDSELRCLRSNMHGQSKTDWMEWQAGYASGAMLMPLSRVKIAVAGFPIAENSSALNVSERETAIVETVSEGFRVSKDAARVRLSQLGILSRPQAQRLF